MENGDAQAATQQKAPWLPQALVKLGRCAQALPGWDSYGGLPLIPTVRTHAERLLQLVKGEPLPVPAVGLGSAGTVQFEWHLHGRELEVEILPDGALGYLKIFRNQAMEEGSVERDVEKGWSDLIRWLFDG